jgi:hypothetical protein
MLNYRDGVLVARSIGERRDGYEEGPSVSVNTDPKSFERGFQTYATLQRGLPIGKITHMDASGLIYAEGVGDGKGGFRQTSNIATPVIAMLGRAMSQNEYLSGAKLFIRMFAPNHLGSNVACKVMMKALQYTDQATNYWCTGLPTK